MCGSKKGSGVGLICSVYFIDSSVKTDNRRPARSGFGSYPKPKNECYIQSEYLISTFTRPYNGTAAAQGNCAKGWLKVPGTRTFRITGGTLSPIDIVPHECEVWEQ